MQLFFFVGCVCVSCSVSSERCSDPSSDFRTDPEPESHSARPTTGFTTTVSVVIHAWMPFRWCILVDLSPLLWFHERFEYAPHFKGCLLASILVVLLGPGCGEIEYVVVIMVLIRHAEDDAITEEEKLSNSASSRSCFGKSTRGLGPCSGAHGESAHVVFTVPRILHNGEVQVSRERRGA